MEYFVSFALVVLAVVFFGFFLRRMTILEYEKGLKYSRGRFQRMLNPGQYWYIPFFVMIHKEDVRARVLSVSGQEILSSDGVSLKISLAVNYSVENLEIAVNKVRNFEESLYLELQTALREIVGSIDIDTLLEKRPELSARLMEATRNKVGDLGLALISVNLKDIMFPGNLKEVFAQVVNARKEGQAALERARGETAALRNLANGARMMEGNPNLMPLRMMQTIGKSTGNTFVLGMPSSIAPMPVYTGHAADGAKGKREEE